MKTSPSSIRLSFVAIMMTIGFAFAGNSSFAQGNSELSSDVKTQIQELNTNLEKTILKKDLSSLPDFYTDDATILLVGGKKIQGRKDIAEYWYSMNQVKSLKSEIVELGGNSKLVYQIGKWTIVKIENGVEKTIVTDVIIVWERENNYQYKIQLNSANNPTAHMAASKESTETVQH